MIIYRIYKTITYSCFLIPQKIDKHEKKNGLNFLCKHQIYNQTFQEQQVATQGTPSKGPKKQNPCPQRGKKRKTSLANYVHIHFKLTYETQSYNTDKCYPFLCTTIVLAQMVVTPFSPRNCDLVSVACRDQSVSAFVSDGHFSYLSSLVHSRTPFRSQHSLVTAILVYQSSLVYSRSMCGDL